MTLPTPVGPRTHSLVELFRQPVPESTFAAPSHPWLLDDALALYGAHQTWYRGWVDVDPGVQGQPRFLELVSEFEVNFEGYLRQRFDVDTEPTARSVSSELFQRAADDDAPSLSRYLQHRASLEQAREYLILRASVQLKEADAQMWIIPRLAGTVQQAFIEVQFDEYGQGKPGQLHSQLWAQTMRSVGLADGELAYVDAWPIPSLDLFNAQTLFGLHPRLVGAALGFFAMVEMTSSLPMAKIKRGFERLGFDDVTTHYFAEHITADAAHEQQIALDVIDPWVGEDSRRRQDVLFGARTCLGLDGDLARHCLTAWERGESALR